MPNGLSGARLLSRDYLLLTSCALLHTMRSARDLSKETHVPSPPFKMSRSWPAAGKAANCSMCSKPWEHANFYTNTTIIVAIIMQVVDLLVIFLYPRKYMHLNAFKNTKWKSKTNETGKTICCSMWCTCIPANGTLLLETSHAVACQCWKASSKLTLQQVECHPLPWGVSTSQNTLKGTLVGKLLPTHVAMKLNIVCRSRGESSSQIICSLLRGKGKASSRLPHKILGTWLLLDILKDFKYGNVSKGSSAKSKSKDEKKICSLLVD